MPANVGWCDALYGIIHSTMLYFSLVSGVYHKKNRGADMYESVSIQRFRGLESVAIDRLAKINLLIGKNGTGKSTILEALWLQSIKKTRRQESIY